jgi:acyl-CoA hydrolase
MTELVLPGDANTLGNAFGGKIMKWIDVAAGVAARRHAGGVSVTASVDSLNFMRPIRLGDVVVLQADVNRAWRSSMEVGVRVLCEPEGIGETVHAVSSYLTFVAVDDQGRPRQVPRLEPETDEDWRRFYEAGERREQRLKTSAQAAGGPSARGVERLLGDLLARLAHDLRNPLMAVRSNLNYLRDEVSGEDQEVVRESLLSLQRGNRLIDDALDLARLRSGMLSPTLDAVRLRSLERPLRRALEMELSRRELQVDLPDVALRTNQALLQRALTAILEHALRNTPSGQVVRLEGALQDGLRLRICDPGPPFSQQAEPSLVAEELGRRPAPAPGCRNDKGLGLYFAGTAARFLGAGVAVLDPGEGARGVVFQLQFPEDLLAQVGNGGNGR